MPINFLQNVSLNNTELQNFKVENSLTLPSGLSGEGQLIYKSNDNTLHYHTGSNSWKTVGSVTSVGISSNYLTIGSTPVTTSGTISVNMPNSGVSAASYTNASITVNAQGIVTAASSGTDNVGVATFTNTNGTFVSAGTQNSAATGAVTMGTIDLSASGSPSATTFLRGDNVWATPAGAYTSWSLEGDNATTVDITDGLRVDFTGGTGISTSVASATPNTLTITNTGVTSISASSPISVDQSTGAVAISYTGGTGTMSSWTIQGDSGSSTVADGQTVDIAGGTYITSAESSRTVTLNHDNTSRSDTTSTDTVGSGGTFTKVDSITTNAQGHVTAINVETITMGSFDNYGSWTLAGDGGGTSQAITSGNTATFLGGTGITTAAGATDDLTITNSLPFNSITLAGSSGGSNSTIANNGTITITAGSNISATGDGSGGVTVAYTGGTGSMSSWTIAGDSGTSTVSNSQTATIAGSTGIDTAESGRTVTVSLDLAELTTITSAAATNELIINSGGNKKIDIDDIHLNQFGDAEADVDFGGNKLLDVATGTSGSDGVNLGQVQSLIAGVGVFQGGYNASTNSPAIAGASNIAADTGDYYVVTTDGTISFNGSTVAVEVGDLIFANESITASSNPAATKYTIVIQDANIAGAGSTDGGTEKGVAGFDSGNFDVTANGWVTLDDTGVSAGSVGGVTKSLSATVTAKGLLTSLTEQTIAIPASQITDFCSAVASCISTNYNFKTTITGAGPFTINHNLNTRDVMVYVYDNASPYEQTFVEVIHTDADNVTLKTAASLGSGVLRVLVTEVL
tara:strand:+ start:3737 stop:6142 length:2406 start_codon:yes stop_codon:yes gene_type:complete